jgi:predicted RNA binding protein YcfA (HicA-like mRNA interferase family)
MPPVLPLKPQEIVAILKHFGFAEVRQRGSHKQFRHDDGRATTVPFHKGRDVSPTLVRKIAQDIGVDIDDFLARR